MIAYPVFDPASHLRGLIQQAFFERMSQKLSHRMHLEFRHQLRSMIVHRLWADRQALRDFCVRTALRKKMENLPLALSKFDRRFKAFDHSQYGWRKMTPTCEKKRETLMHIFHRAGLEDNAIDLRSDPFGQMPTRGYPRHKANSSLRRPATNFAIDLHTFGHRHGAVQRQQRGLERLAERDSFNPVFCFANNLNASNTGEHLPKSAANNHVVICDDDRLRFLSVVSR